jgi:GrpB-like predicted nucleotidyltransferase (UPF0157 family)
MATEEQMQASRIGGLHLHNAPIQLSAYCSEWPALFHREARRIRAVLGKGVLRLEHVGSTSVPGLSAKPIIDMMLAVADSADEPAYLPAMVVAGYALRIRESDWYEHRLLKGPDTDINLHVFSLACPEIDRMLLFRDWLRSNDAERDLYERSKCELAKRTWKYVQNYADAKTSVVEEIIARARAARVFSRDSN